MSRLLPPHISFELPNPNMEKLPSSELTPTRLGFPNEFPYEFESSVFSPGFTSPGDSTETEDESSDDEEDFLAGLTRRLAPSTHRIPLPSFNTKYEEKREVAATSPQSTLSGLGSLSNSGSRSPVIPSPQPSTTTSFRKDNTWDVISAAAGEVARLKLGNFEPVHLPLQTPESLLRRQNAALQNENYRQQQRLIDQMILSSSQSRFRLSESHHHYPKRVINEEITFQNPNLRYMRNHKNVLSNPSWVSPQLAGTPLKRPSAGTGVFLPRRYPTTDVMKNPVNNTAPKGIHHNHSLDEFNIVTPQRLSQFDYECMLAKSTILGRQGNLRAVGGSCLTQEKHLPQDWMY